MLQEKSDVLSEKASSILIHYVTVVEKASSIVINHATVVASSLLLPSRFSAFDQSTQTVEAKKV